MRPSPPIRGPTTNRTGTVARPASARRVSGAWAIAAAAAAVLALYVVVYPLRGFRVPLGSDTPVYEWWVRRAQVFGLGAADTGGRPAVVGVMASLEAVLPAGMDSIAAAMGPVLAAVTGLAAGSLIAVSFREDGDTHGRFVLTTVLSGAFLVFLVSGYLSTLAFAGLFLGALACLTRSFGTGRAAVVSAAVLGGAAALSHPILVALAALVVAGGALALIPGFRRDRRSGMALHRTALGRVALSAGGAAALFGGGTLAVGLHTGSTVDTSRDAFLGRVGLLGLIERSYMAVLTHTFTWWRALTVTVGAVFAAFPLRRRATRTTERDDRPGWFWGLMAAWLTLTAGAVAALLAGLRVPGQRVAQLALPLPVLAAMGLWRVRSKLRRPLGTVVLLAASAGYVAVMWSAWWDVTPLVPSRMLSEARTLAARAASAPPGTPIVLVADDDSSSPARFLIRSVNYVRAEMPPGRILDVRLFVGTPRDLLEGRPGVTGHTEHDRLSADAWDALRRSLARGPPLVLAVALRSVDLDAYQIALGLPGTARMGPGVAILAFGAGRPTGTIPVPRPASDPAIRGGQMSPWAPVWVAPLLLALLALLGSPWARLALRHAAPSVRIGLAPAFGLAAVGLGSIGVDAVGLRLGTAAGAVAALLLPSAVGILAVRIQGRALPDRPNG